jgi:multidrug efflux system membrane fusion protein
MSITSACRGPAHLVFSFLTLALFGCDEKHPQAVATPPPAVEVARPIERSVSDYQVFTARTQAVQSVDLKARVTGYLTKILFKDGDSVNEGDVLFQIDDRPYKAALDQAKGALDQSKAALELAKANLVKAQAEYDIGLSVQKQNPGAISEQEITRRLGARDEAKAGIDEAKASIERAQAALENAQLNYGWCKVTSPINGRTTRHLVDVGNVIGQNATVLVNIVSLKPVWAYVNVDQNTALRVQALAREGKVKAVRTGDIPVGMSVGPGAGDRFPIGGVVDYVGNQVDPNTGTIQARSVFANEDLSLVAGLFARIRVPLTAPHPALLVNDLALGTNQGQKYLLVVNDKDEVEYRGVDVGQVHDGLREVMRFRNVVESDSAGGDVSKKVEVLKPTDRVIVNGLQRVRQGVKVEPKMVDMQTLLVVAAPEGKDAPPASSK